VRYAETDQMGIAHHASYLVWVEEARTRMMAERGCSYGALEREGLGLPVRRAELRYRAPARYEEEVVVSTRVERLRGASILFAYELRRSTDGELLATATTELACVDLRDPAWPVVPLPEALRELLGGAGS
jgi:acyl-CoA thioester hydrolase